MQQIHVGTFGGPWHYRTPTAYRCMGAKHVEDFFRDGTLQLSSFAAFRTHKDEKRRDTHEGMVAISIETPDGNGINGILPTPPPAYVLSASTIWPTYEELQDKELSYIAITDTTAFAAQVARQIPGCNAGIEGFCLYNASEVLRCFDDRPFPNPRDVPPDQFPAMLQNYMAPHVIEAYFLKRYDFVKEAEYRFIWFVDAPNKATTIVQAPLARTFCRRVTPRTVERIAHGEVP